MKTRYRVTFSFRLGTNRYLYGEINEDIKEYFVAAEIRDQLSTLPNCVAHIQEKNYESFNG